MAAKKGGKKAAKKGGAKKGGAKKAARKGGAKKAAKKGGAKRVPNAAFMKPMQPDAALSAVVGGNPQAGPKAQTRRPDFRGRQ